MTAGVEVPRLSDGEVWDHDVRGPVRSGPSFLRATNGLPGSLATLCMGMCCQPQGRGLVNTAEQEPKVQQFSINKKSKHRLQCLMNDRWFLI